MSLIPPVCKGEFASAHWVEDYSVSFFADSRHDIDMARVDEHILLVGVIGLKPEVPTMRIKPGS